MCFFDFWILVLLFENVNDLFVKYCVFLSFQVLVCPGVCKEDEEELVVIRLRARQPGERSKVTLVLQRSSMCG